MTVESPYTRPIQIGSATLGGGFPFVVIAAPAGNGGVHDVDEVLHLAVKLAAEARERDVPLIFRVPACEPAAEFDDTLAVVDTIRNQVRLPVAIQVSELRQVGPAARAADLLQIPAACCRDTDLLAEAAHTGRPVNIEMDSRVTTEDAVNLLADVAGMGNWNVTLTDCRTLTQEHSVDPREFTTIRESGFPLVVDAGHNADLAVLALGAGVDGVCVSVKDSSGFSSLLQRLKGSPATS